MPKIKVFAAIALMSVMTARAADALPCAGISVFHWTIQHLARERGISISQASELFKAAGVDGFDCGYDDVQLHEFAATCLKPINLFGGVKFRVPDRGEAQIRDFLATAVRYHVPRVMVIPDYFTDGVPNEQEFKDIVDGFRRFVAAAQKVGVTVTVETFGGKKNPCSYATYVKRLLDEVPGLCFALDTGNLYFAGRGDDIVDVAHHASNRISHVHLKDWKKGLPPIGPKGERNYETIGLGAIPNEELVRYAQAVGFRGWYTLEHPLPGDTLGDTVRQVAVLKYWLSSPKPSTAAVPNRLWKEIVFETPETRPMRFGGWSRSTEARFGDYAVVMDVYYADGSHAWDRRASFAPGTHDWSYSAGVFTPCKPVKKVKVAPVARKGSGKAEFTGLFFDFEVFDGMPLRTELRTSRPFADVDEKIVIVRDEKKPKNLDFYERKEGFVSKPVPLRERQFLLPTLAAGSSEVWTADSMRRVTPLTFPGTNETHAISLELARREHESAQVLVSTAADVEWTKGELSVGAFADASGKPFRGTVEWRRVGYVPREPGFSVHPYGTDLREKWIPDPLLPGAPFRVRKGATQALWITAYAADDAVPGVYRGKIVVTERGECRAVVPVELTVHDFSLPKTFGLKTAFAVMDGFLKARYPNDLVAKRRAAWDILLDHRLNPDDITRTTLPDVDDLVYARSRGMNHFTVLNIVPETKPGKKWTLIADPNEIFTPEFYAAFTARLRPYVARLREKNLLDIAALYGFDERGSEYYAGIDEMWKKLKVDFPELPLLTSAKMYADLAANKTNLPALVTADIYAPCTYRWKENVTAMLRAAGKKVWWYTCCSPFAPYANFASYESPTAEGRLLLGFMTHKYRADGFLFWHVNNWKEDRHPTMKAGDTFFPDWKTRSWVGCPGDGVFLYPGEDEIFPSVRLAQIRDGVEDYEWLQLAVEKSGRAAVDAVSAGLVTSLTEFERDPAAIRLARRKIADLIEHENMKGKNK